MSIPLEVLVNWAKPGKSDNSKTTYEKLKKVLEINLNGNYEIFLQGSYHNVTHVKENSDIDIVVLDNDIFIDNTMFGLRGNLNDLRNYKNYLFYKIQNTQGFNFALGNKTIKYAGNYNYVPVDIVPCGYYRGVTVGAQIGTILFDNKKQKYFINYPKQHYEYGTLKSQQTNGNFKKTVRMFKNAKNYAVKKGLLKTEEIAPSYFLECLIYNVPNNCFVGNEQEVFYNVIAWLFNNTIFFENMKCQNGIQKLFGNDDPWAPIIYNKWKVSEAVTFVNVIAQLWDNWSVL